MIRLINPYIFDKYEPTYKCNVFGSDIIKLQYMQKDT